METGQSQSPSPEQRHFYRRIDTPEARQYAEWCLLAADLERCHRIVSLWKDKGEAGDKDVAISLYRDAIVSFISCFRDNETNRVSLDETALYAQMKGGLEYFRGLETLRDTWVAHRHGPSRQTMVAVMVDENNGAFRGIGRMLGQLNHPDLAGADDFIEFVRIAVAEAKNEENAALEVVRQQVKELSPNERLRLPVAEVTVPGISESRMGRKKFTNITKRSRGRRDGE